MRLRAVFGNEVIKLVEKWLGMIHGVVTEALNA